MPDWLRHFSRLFFRRFAIRVTLAWSAAVVAHAGVFSTAEYRERAWTTDDGLPHNTVNAVLQDTAGYMWFATLGGLARFDGHEVTEIALPDAVRSGRLNVRSFAEERPGVLDVVLASNRVYRLTGEAWTLHPVTAALPPGDGPLALHLDPAGNLWVATTGGMVVRWTPRGGGRVYGPRGGLAPRTHLVTFAAGPGGSTWIAGDRLWSASLAGELTLVTDVTSAPQMIGAGRGGRLWIWTNRTLEHLQDGKLVVDYEDPDAASLGSIHQLFEDREGTLWLSTSRAGLVRFSEGRLIRVGVGSSVASVFEDREGSLWVATEAHGVVQLREKSYRVFDAARGLKENVVSSVCADPHGGVWLANRGGGVAFVDPDGVLQRSHDKTFTNVVCADTQNQLWFGGSSSGVLRWRIGGPASTRMPVPSVNPHVLFCARNGDVWFAADANRVGYYRGGVSRLFVAADGFAPDEIHAIAQDTTGDIWLGGRNGGLQRWNGRAFQAVPLPDDLRQTPIHTIFADEENRLWIGTPRGLIVRDGAGFHLLTRANGLLDDIIQAIVEDRQGRLWFASRRGVFYAAKVDLVAALTDSGHAINCHRLGANVGLIGLTPTPNYSPSACIATDGSLWFATEEGAVAVDPARQAPALPSPSVVVEAVRLDGAPVAVDGAVRIPSGRHRIDIHLAALTYVAPDSVVLRHRLAGVDKDWVDTGSDRIASYTNLPPGAYQLSVAVRNRAGIWNPVAATLVIRVTPAWWETVAFRACALVLLVVLVAWTARTLVERRLQRRLRRLEHQHAFERERVRIARDLHDELGASLTEVGLAADRLVASVPHEFELQLSGLAWRIRRVATELSSIVWAMNREESRLQDLAVFLRRYAERLFRHTGTRILVSGVDTIPPVPIAQGIQHHVLAATREALNNILKHAGASEATLALRYADGVLEVRVSDDGRGFKVGAPGGWDGNGLRNMRARLAEIGGRFACTSAPGAGARVVFRVPVAAGAKVDDPTHADENCDC